MSLYTLDTNVVAAILRQDSKVIAELESCLLARHEVTLNAISYFETRRGLSPSHTRKRLLFEGLAHEVGVLELTRSALNTAADIYQQLRGEGRLIEDADILIAGIAIAKEATLVTRNLKHLGRIAALKLETWEV